MSQKYPGGFITKSPPLPSGPFETSTAPGVWTLDQAMQLKKQGLWPTAGNIAPPTVIGQAFGGGFWAGDIGVSSIATHHLVVCPRSSGQTLSLWKTAETTTSGTTSLIDGPANTAAMIAAGASAHPAAFFCNNLNVGGFSDWYMPAKNELEILYFNLKPTTTSSLTNSGANPNAVPVRGSNYTSNNPSQTSVAAFQASGSESFIANTYWSSTQATYSKAWSQGFSNGYQRFVFSITANLYLRAVRRVPV